MDASVDASVRADGERFTAADARLLRAIDETGSVSGASDRLGRSRARALDRLEALEAAFGSLVERRRGGEGGGGSDLTAAARDLLARFDRLRATLAGTADTEECVFHGTVTDREGELGVVDTDIGAVRALLAAAPGSDDTSRAVDGASAANGDGASSADAPPGVGDAVQVSVRSDAVTLHAPAEAPPAGATSARNRFEGTVVDVDRGTAIARVTVDVGGVDGPVALLTHGSLDRLELAPGSPVVASFKATATRAIPVVRPADER